MKHGNIAIFIPHNGCPQRCTFCDQGRITGESTQPTAAQVEGIVASGVVNLGNRAGACEIAFFGGSFTAIDRRYMVSLLEAAKTAVQKWGLMGIRISTRPDAIDAQVLSLLKYYGVTAIELGAQSMSDAVLRLNTRGHSAECVRIAAHLIRAHGFELGLQMMTGLYGSTEETDYQTAVEITKLTPNTVRIYPTVTLAGTELCNLYRSGAYIPPNLPETVSLCVRIIELFKSNRIRIIRVGLHATEELQTRRIAGPYHPAFMELCLAEQFLNRVVTALQRVKLTNVEILVNPKTLSQALGQKRGNIQKLSNMGFTVIITPCDGIPDFEIIERK